MPRMPRHFNLERLMGVEPTYAAWEAAVLPMNYSRRNKLYYSRPFPVLQYEIWRLRKNSPGGHRVSRPVPGGSSPPQKHQNYPVNHRRQRPEGNHRPGHGEHLRRHAGDKALWLCQDRHTVFSEFFQLPPKWGALIVLACRYKFKPARSTHIYLNLS